MPRIGGGNIGGGTGGTTTGGALPWLVVNGTKVFEGAGGRQYRTTGWNNYVMKVAGGTPAQTMNATQRENFFAGLRPNSLVRVWFFAPVPPSYTWAQVLTELDAIVASAKKYGHRLIASLTGQAQAANDAFGGKTAAWYQARNWRTAVSGATSLEAWTKTVVARYANEPTVAIYDLCNEPNDTGGVFTADLTLYAQEMSGYVKGIAPNALTYMGVQYVSILGGQTQYQTVFANLDFCSSHFYDTTGHFTSKAGVVLAARALGKPLLIDEFGVWAKPFYGSPKSSGHSCGPPWTPTPPGSTPPAASNHPTGHPRPSPSATPASTSPPGSSRTPSARCRRGSTPSRGGGTRPAHSSAAPTRA
jgi:hypothetical protein